MLRTSDGQSSVADIVAGVGFVNVTTTLAHTVLLSLLDSFSTHLAVSSTSSIQFLPDVTAKYVILQPTAGSVDDSFTIVIHALDRFNNLNPLETRSIRLVSSGSSFGFGVVSVSNGMGSIVIRDHTPETVSLSLALDGPLPSIDISSTRQLVIVPGVARSFVIENVTDSVSSVPVEVLITARDQYNNLAIFEQRDVTLVASGSRTEDGVIIINDRDSTFGS